MDFTKPGICDQIATNVRDEINAYSSTRRPTRHSRRLSPSNLGEECTASLWYKWRWVKDPEPLDGRMARLFERGDSEEPRIIEYLRATGWTVQDCDPATGKQWSVIDFNGHLKAKLDGIGSHPIHTRGINVLLEFKSYNTKRFVQLTNKPLKTEDPKYYGQICLYMMYYDLPACLFYPVNKNDDDIWPIVFPRDDGFAKELLRKGETIITSKVRPARIAESASYWKCKTCDFAGICHRNEPVAINCRSCEHCIPAPDGKFYCEQWQAVIPGDDEIKAACGHHKPVR